MGKQPQPVERPDVREDVQAFDEYVLAERRRHGLPERYDDDTRAELARILGAAS